jgi:hypothetical protein
MNLKNGENVLHRDEIDRMETHRTEYGTALIWLQSSTYGMKRRLMLVQVSE